MYFVRRLIEAFNLVIMSVSEWLASSGLIKLSPSSTTLKLTRIPASYSTSSLEFSR